MARELKVRNLRGGAPAVLLAQLGVDTTYSSRGLGSFLLKRALVDSFQVARRAGGVAVLVDALDRRRSAWYEKNADFRALKEDGCRLMLPMRTLAKGIDAT